MEIDLARPADLSHLAQLLWLHAAPEEQQAQSVEGFATDLRTWWLQHEQSHIAFVARLPDGTLVGMAWLALLPRVPRPGTTRRLSADLQSVYVLEQHRGNGIGARLVNAASEHARDRGAGTVTVQSGRRAVRLYERLGFAASPQLLQQSVDGTTRAR